MYYSIKMEEKTMITQWIGLVIGCLVLGAGIYYLVKENQDDESKKIYTIISVIGALLAVLCALLLIF